eukprot:scaffold34129_cov32-Tisochrysis_lutea.AAC.1
MVVDALEGVTARRVVSSAHVEKLRSSMAVAFGSGGGGGGEGDILSPSPSPSPSPRPTPRPTPTAKAIRARFSLACPDRLLSSIACDGRVTDDKSSIRSSPHNLSPPVPLLPACQSFLAVLVQS